MSIDPHEAQIPNPTRGVVSYWDEQICEVQEQGNPVPEEIGFHVDEVGLRNKMASLWGTAGGRSDWRVC